MTHLKLRNGTLLWHFQIYNNFSDTSILFLEVSKHGCWVIPVTHYSHELHWSFPDPALLAGCYSLLGFLLLETVIWKREGSGYETKLYVHYVDCEGRKLVISDEAIIILKGILRTDPFRLLSMQCCQYSHVHSSEIMSERPNAFKNSYLKLNHTDTFYIPSFSKAWNCVHETSR